jgi:hypothetical protein
MTEQKNRLGERFSQGAEPVENLKGEEATLFLGISADGSPLFLHHVANLGSTRRAPEPALVALVGLQKSTIVNVLIPRDCFASIPSGEEEDEAGEFFVPPFLKLSLSTTASAFKKASPSSKHPLSLEVRCLIPVPPFLVPCMAENAHSSFAELGLACAEHIVGSEILCESKKMASVDHCQKLVHFMWWAAKPDDTTMAYRVALTLIADPKPSIVRWRNIAIKEALGRATPVKPNESLNTKPSSTATFSEALGGTLGSLKETMESIKLKDANSATEESKHFARLPKHLQRLLYRLSYVPGEPEPTKLSEEGENFMAQHTLASATSLLKTTLRQKYGLSVMVQAASVQALRIGQLVWDDPSSPGNHSIFQYYSPTPSHIANSASELAWHLTSTEGRGVEGAGIKKAMKLRPRAAGSVFGCSRQVLHFGCVHGFLYEDGCPIHESLKGFSEWMLSVGAISTLERLAARHDKFYERLLTTLDTRVQEYASSCANADKAEAIESSLLNLETRKQNLRLQNVSNLAGAVFPEATTPATGIGKRPAERGVAEGVKSKPAQTITLTRALPSRPTPNGTRSEGSPTKYPRCAVWTSAEDTTAARSATHVARISTDGSPRKYWQPRKHGW